MHKPTPCRVFSVEMRNHALAIVAGAISRVSPEMTSVASALRDSRDPRLGSTNIKRKFGGMSLGSRHDVI